MEQVILDHWSPRRPMDPMYIVSGITGNNIQADHSKNSQLLISLFGKYPNFIKGNFEKRDFIVSGPFLRTGYFEDRVFESKEYYIKVNNFYEGYFLKVEKYDIKLMEYFKGYTHGILIVWDENGRIRKRENYKWGVIDGLQKYLNYYTNQYREIVYKGGEIISESQPD